MDGRGGQWSDMGPWWDVGRSSLVDLKLRWMGWAGLGHSEASVGVWEDLAWLAGRFVTWIQWSMKGLVRKNRGPQHCVCCMCAVHRPPSERRPIAKCRSTCKVGRSEVLQASFFL